MNGSSTIFDFIDGSLDHIREQELFDDLARHPEMRSELRHYIAIGEAVRADREAYAPPSEVEHALMAGLGLAPIASVGGAGVAGSGSSAGTSGAGFFGRFASFRGLAPHVGSFVAGVLIATGGFFAAFSAIDVAPVTSVRDTIFVREAPRAAGTTLAAAPTAELPRARAAAPIIDRAPSAAIERTRRNAPARVDRALAAEVAAPVESPSAIEQVDAPAFGGVIAPVAARLAERAAATPIALDSGASSADVRGLDQNAETFASLMSMRDAGVGYGELRSNAWMQPFVDNNARHLDGGLDEEMVAGMFVRMGENFTAGLEVGQGRYPQVLVYPETYTDNGAPVGRRIERIEQEPTVAWLGLAGRWELGAISRKLPFWTQLTLGYGFDQGPMLNGRAGVDFNLSRTISLTGALETTSLVYFFNGQPLVSGKYGLSLGVQLGM